MATLIDQLTGKRTLTWKAPQEILDNGSVSSVTSVVPSGDALAALPPPTVELVTTLLSSELSAYTQATTNVAQTLTTSVPIPGGGSITAQDLGSILTQDPSAYPQAAQAYESAHLTNGSLDGLFYPLFLEVQQDLSAALTTVSGIPDSPAYTSLLQIERSRARQASDFRGQVQDTKNLLSQALTSEVAVGLLTGFANSLTGSARQALQTAYNVVHTLRVVTQYAALLTGKDWKQNRQALLSAANSQFSRAFETDLLNLLLQTEERVLSPIVGNLSSILPALSVIHSPAVEKAIAIAMDPMVSLRQQLVEAMAHRDTTLSTDYSSRRQLLSVATTRIDASRGIQVLEILETVLQDLLSSPGDIASWVQVATERVTTKTAATKPSPILYLGPAPGDPGIAA